MTKPDKLLAEIQEQTRIAAQADAAVSKETPDSIEIDGVTYYRNRAGAPQEPVDPDPEIEQIVIDVAPHAGFIMIDGVKFFAGFAYKVTKHQARNMRDVMALTWKHEKQTGGAFMNLPSARNLHMSAMGGGRNFGPMGAPGISGI